jgi:site-specific recombinase XerD
MAHREGERAELGWKRDTNLTLAQASRIMRKAMKDQSYRATPLGELVGRYIRLMRNDYGATPSTIRDYDAILARMSLTLADKESIDVQTDDLRDVIDLWADQSSRTRQKVTSVIRAFWTWMEDDGHVLINPAATKAEKRVARVLPSSARPRLLPASHEPRDRLGLHCLLGLGLRRAELAGVQVRDFDQDRSSLRVFGKGQKERTMPLRGRIKTELDLFMSVELPHVGRLPEGDDYLLYPIKTLAAGKTSRNTLIQEYVAYPKKRPSNQSVHRWWYRMAEKGRTGWSGRDKRSEHASGPPSVRRRDAQGGRTGRCFQCSGTFGREHHPGHRATP